MDPERASDLLAAERSQIERALRSRGRVDDGDEAGWQEPGNLAADLYLDELDASIADELRDWLAALGPAEQRLAAGTYGLSIESGRPLPGRRLAALSPPG